MTSIDRQRIGAANADAQLALVLRLRDIRKSKAILVSDVAEAMKVDVAMVYRFEKGETNFTAATLRKYAKAVGAILRLDAVDASSSPEAQGFNEWVV